MLILIAFGIVAFIGAFFFIKGLIFIWQDLPLSIKIRHIVIKAVICALILLIAWALVFRGIRGFFPMELEMNWLVHMVKPPNDLYQPIVEDKFEFATKGYSKTYNLSPRYLDPYELGFLVDQNGIESRYKYKGKLKIEFFRKDKLLFYDVATSIKHARYQRNDLATFDKISLYEFEIPLQGKYLKDISVRITVLEPDSRLAEINNSTTLYIAVGSLE
ncbi:MAG: hypothetical protein ACE14V_00555 [bacterium]